MTKCVLLISDTQSAQIAEPGLTCTTTTAHGQPMTLFPGTFQCPYMCVGTRLGQATSSVVATTACTYTAIIAHDD